MRYQTTWMRGLEEIAVPVGSPVGFEPDWMRGLEEIATRLP